MRVGAASMIAAHDLLAEARARRVDDQDVGAAGLLDEVAQRRADVAREEARVADLVAPGVGDRVRDRLLDDLQAPHLAGARGHGQPDRPDPAEEVEDALPALQARVLARDAVEPLGHLRVRLEERVGADAEAQPADLLLDRLGRRAAPRRRRPAVVSADARARASRPGCRRPRPRPGRSGPAGRREVTRRTCSSPVRRPSRTTTLRSSPSCVRRSQARRPALAAPGDAPPRARRCRARRRAGSPSAGRSAPTSRARGSRRRARRRPPCRTSTRACCGSATPARPGRSAPARSRRGGRCARSASPTWVCLTSSWRA